MADLRSTPTPRTTTPRAAARNALGTWESEGGASLSPRRPPPWASKPHAWQRVPRAVVATASHDGRLVRLLGVLLGTTAGFAVWTALGHAWPAVALSLAVGLTISFLVRPAADADNRWRLVATAAGLTLGWFLAPALGAVLAGTTGVVAAFALAALGGQGAR